MSDIHDEIIRGDISDIKNLDSWIRLNGYCCRKVKEYMCLIQQELFLKSDSNDSEKLENVQEYILKLPCETFRELLEINYKKWTSKDDIIQTRDHISKFLQIWDECLASGNQNWSKKNS